MKKITSILFLLFSLSFIFAEAEVSSAVLNPKTGFPEITNKPFIMFNEGLTSAQTTRIIVQDDYYRSNFVWQDYFVGAFCEMQTGNMKPYNSLVRVAVYYPVGHTFNGMNQISTQMLLYGIDLYAGVLFESDMWKYLNFKWSIGPHFSYDLSDEWHHLEAGVGSLLGAELPVSSRWSAIINGLASLDYGNFGSNRKIMPYNVVWKYQLEIGIRYSKKGINNFSYINH